MWCTLFPGQGSQQVGMGRFLFDNFSSVKQLFEEASDTLKINFQKLCFEGPEDELQKTENTQPALLLVSIASFNTIREVTGVNIDFSAGHSVGEYAACVSAKSIMLQDALKAVRSRGQYMQSAVPLGQGGMLAVMGLSSEQILQLCTWAEKESGAQPFEPANFNSPGQVVCSGSSQTIQWLQDNFRKDIFKPEPKKVRLIPLKVSAPFHCSMMKPAEEKMAKVLQDITFQKAEFPIIQNVTAEPETAATEIRQNLVKQISAPVLWDKSMEKLIELGCNRAIELGSGSVLKGLAKKIAGDRLKVFSLNSLDNLQELENSI